MIEPPLGFGVEQEARDIACEPEDGGLLRQRVVVGPSRLCCCDHQYACDREKQHQRGDLLFNSGRRLRSELTLADVVAFHELEEFFGFPAQVVELAELRSADLRSAQRGEEKRRAAIGRFESDRPQRKSRPLMRRAARRIDVKEVVVASALTKLVDCGEGVRGRNTNEEIDFSRRERMQDFVGWIASIEDEHFAFGEAWKHAEQLLALARRERRNFKIDGRFCAHVEEHADEDLRAIAGYGHAELPCEVWTSLQIDLGAVDCEYAPTEPALTRTEGCARALGQLMQHAAQQVAGDLGARVAKRRRRDGLDRRQHQAKATRLVPESIKQVPVAAPIAVGDHVEQERGDELRLKRPVAGEVASITKEALVFDCREKSGNVGGKRATVCDAGTKIGRVSFVYRPVSESVLVLEQDSRRNTNTATVTLSRTARGLQRKAGLLAARQHGKPAVGEERRGAFLEANGIGLQTLGCIESI